MEKKSAFGPSVLSGIYLGVVLILFSLITYLLDFPYDSPVKYFSYLILAIGLYLSIISFRNKHNGGFISYGGAFSSGFYTAIFASLLTGIFTYIYVVYIDTGLIEQILLDAEEQTLQKYPEMSDEQLEQTLSYTEMFTSPFMMSIFGFLGNLVSSTLLSLIIAIFAKRENKEIA